MQTAWTDFFYGGQPSLFPPLDSHSWSRWSTNVIQLLDPFENVTAILQGLIKPEEPLYSTTIDIELYFLLQQDLRSIAVEVRNEHGIKGSKLYEALKSRFEKKGRSNHDDVWKAVNEGRRGVKFSRRAILEAKRAERRAESGRLTSKKSKGKANSEGTTIEDRKEEEVKVIKGKEEATSSCEDKNDGGDDRTASFDAIGSEVDQQCDGDVKYQKEESAKPDFGAGCPKLAPQTWSRWSDQLKKNISSNIIHHQILTGAIDEGHRDYDAELDEELFLFIKSSMKHYFVYLILEIADTHGKKGSKLYVALESEVRSLREKEIQRSINLLRRASDVVSHIFIKYERIYIKAQEYDMPFAEDQIVDFVQEVEEMFTDCVQLSILKDVGCHDLRQYCALILHSDI